MKLANYQGQEDRASMYFIKSNDAPMRSICCPYCGRHLMRINYNLVEFTNSAGITIEQARIERSLLMEWRCRNCKTIYSLHFVERV